MRAASAWLTSAAHIRFTWDGLHPASSAVLVMLWPERLSFSEGDCTKYQESAALPELAACKAA